jgi:hypothetical protein
MNAYYITGQANGNYSIYTNTGMESLADETLIKYDLSSEFAAEMHVTNVLNGSFSYNV